MYVCMYELCVRMYIRIYVRTYAYVCMHVCTYVGMYVCIQHTKKSACVYDQIRICHFLKQHLLLLQFTLKSIMTEMYLPKPTILRNTVLLAAKAVK